MKNLLFVVCLVAIGMSPLLGQYDYEPSNDNPYGLPHPDAPAEIMDYQPMIGICDCTSVARNQDGTWKDAEKMTWEFKYIMNGKAVQDQTLKADGGHSGSIRQYIADSS